MPGISRGAGTPFEVAYRCLPARRSTRLDAQITRRATDPKRARIDPFEQPEGNQRGPDFANPITPKHAGQFNLFEMI